MQIKLTVQEIHRKADTTETVDDKAVAKKCYTLVVRPDGGRLEYRPADGAFLLHGCGQEEIDALDIGATITLKD